MWGSRNAGDQEAGGSTAAAGPRLVREPEPRSQPNGAPEGDGFWTRLVRCVPIGWRIFLVVAINAIGLGVLSLLIWQGVGEVGSAWRDLRAIREYDRLLVDVDSEASRLQSLIHRYFNRPTDDVLREIVRRQDELMSRLSDRRIVDTELQADLRGFEEITKRFLFGFDALREVNEQIRAAYEGEFVPLATEMSGLYAIIDSATDNNHSLIWSALGKSRESFSQVLVEANAFYLSRSPDALDKARDQIATIERTTPVMLDLAENELQRSALAKLGPRAAGLRAALEKIASSFDRQARFLGAAIDGNQAAMSASIDRASDRIRSREAMALARFDGTLQTVTRRVTAVGVVFLAMSMLGSFVVARSIRTPLRDLRATMRAIVDGDYERVIHGLDARDEIGGMAASVEVFRENVIAKQRVEKEREEQERRWRLILETSPIGVAIVAGDTGQQVFTNHKYEEMFGVGDPAKRATRSFRDNFAAASDAVRLSDAVKRFGAVSGWEVAMTRGDEVWSCLLEVRPIEFAGRPAHIFWHYDVTDRRRAEDELRSAKEHAESTLAELKDAQASLVEAEKLAAIGGLVAGVAHEVNNPVGISLTVASSLIRRVDQFQLELAGGQLKKSRLDEFLSGAREAAAQLVANLTRAGELVQSFKQVAVDRTHADRRFFDLKESTEQIVASLRPTLKKTQHQLFLDLPEGVEMDSYPGAFGQVVTNLFMNALIHGFAEEREGGHLVIRSRLIDADHVEFIVEDDGVGMGEEIVRHAFDPFFTTRRGAGGTGLGLHIVYNIVNRRLGGRITLESAPGRGTRFRIVLPRVAPHEELANDEARKTKAGEHV